MSQIADIIAFDGASTPVSHTLKAVSVTRDKGLITAEWRENKSGVPVYAQVRCTAKMQRNGSGVWRCEQRVVVPVMESISGQNSAGYTAAPKIAYENTVVITGYFHERSDEAGRRLTRQLALNIMGNVSTTVTPASSGPMPELFDQLIQVS